MVRINIHSPHIFSSYILYTSSSFIYHDYLFDSLFCRWVHDSRLFCGCLWGEYASSLCFLHLLFVPQNWANLSLFLFIFPILCFHIILSLFLLFWSILAFMPPISTLIFFFGVLANMCCNFSWYVNNLLFSQISWYIALHGGKIEAFSFKSHSIFFYLQITNPGDCFFYLQITIPADCLLLSWTLL